MQEMTAENGLAAMAHEESIHAIQVLLTQPKPSPMFQQPSSSQMPPQFVADAVAENSGDGDHKDEDPQIEQPLSRKEASHQHQALARHDQAQQRLAFQRHDKKDDEVTPMTEVAYQIDQVIEHDPASPSEGAMGCRTRRGLREDAAHRKRIQPRDGLRRTVGIPFSAKAENMPTAAKLEAKIFLTASV